MAPFTLQKPDGTPICADIVCPSLVTDALDTVFPLEWLEIVRQKCANNVGANFNCWTVASMAPTVHPSGDQPGEALTGTEYKGCKQGSNVCHSETNT